MSASDWVAVAALGGAGALTRFLLDGALSLRVRSGLPLGTFAVNASGAFALGLLSGLAVRDEALVLAGTAAIGSYTTFSTWLFETQRLREDGELAAAALNVVASLLVGLGAVALGRAIGTAL